MEPLREQQRRTVDDRGRNKNIYPPRQGVFISKSWAPRARHPWSACRLARPLRAWLVITVLVEGNTLSQVRCVGTCTVRRRIRRRRQAAGLPAHAGDTPYFVQLRVHTFSPEPSTSKLCSKTEPCLIGISYTVCYIHECCLGVFEVAPGRVARLRSPFGNEGLFGY